jgi:hypothetical protein
MHNCAFNLSDVIVFSIYSADSSDAAPIAEYIFKPLLILLLVMNLLWTHMLLKMLYKYMVVGQVGLIGSGTGRLNWLWDRYV